MENETQQVNVEIEIIPEQNGGIKDYLFKDMNWVDYSFWAFVVCDLVSLIWIGMVKL